MQTDEKSYIPDSPSFLLRIAGRLLKFIFHQLYHSFAWSYDLVSGFVSLGMWRDWIQAGLDHIQGPCVLELGHGPGHLQKALSSRGFSTFGLDESRQMGSQARQRLRRDDQDNPDCSMAVFPNLARGLAQALPFRGSTFHSLVATFPTQYIFHPNTAQEAYRVLRPGGRVVIVLSAWITGQKLPEKVAAWLFRVTGESADWHSLVEKPYRQAGFQVEYQWLPVRSGRILLIVAQKPDP